MTDSISPIAIVDEMRHSYLDYAMSVIVSGTARRARWAKACASAGHVCHARTFQRLYPIKVIRVVGDVIITPSAWRHRFYDADGWLRILATYPMVDGQGNFGSIDDDPAAAMRYTEVRMTASRIKCLPTSIKTRWIGRTTTTVEADAKAATCPHSQPIVNGATGIAVGMATNMAPHNLTEVINACLAYAENPHITGEELANYISGPTSRPGVYNGRAGIVDAYRTGKGRQTFGDAITLSR